MRRNTVPQAVPTIAALEILDGGLVHSVVELPNILTILATVIVLEICNVFAVHHAGNLVSLPLLECKAWSAVRVVLLIRLVLMVLDLDKVGVGRRRIQREGHQCVDRGRLDTAREGPGLFAW